MAWYQSNDILTEFVQPLPETHYSQRNRYLKCQCMTRLCLKTDPIRSTEDSLGRSCSIAENSAARQETQQSVSHSQRSCYRNGFIQMKHPNVHQAQMKQDVGNYFNTVPVDQEIKVPNDQRFRSTIVQWVPCRNTSQTKIILHSDGNQKKESLHLDMSQELRNVRASPETKSSLQESKFSKLQWFYIILAWLITVLGIGIYLHILYIAFYGDHTFLSKSSVLILITVLSNVCLLSAIYFHQKIRQYFL